MAISLYDPTALGATALASLVSIPLFGEAAGFACGVAGILALVGLWLTRPVFKLIALVPQQLLLLISAGGAVAAISAGMYADGTIRSRAFIAVDQVPAILTALCHTMAIVRATEEGK